MNYCRDFDDDGALDAYTEDTRPTLSPRDKLGAQAIFGFANSLTLPARNFCHGGGPERPFVGRFNQDAQADLLCLNVSTGEMRVDLADFSGQFNSVDWSASPNFCTGSLSRLVVGDANADGRDDLICNNRSTGAIQVAYASSTGQFPTTSNQASFCGSSTGSTKLLATDVTGDKRVDLVCQRANGVLEVDFANSTGQYRGSNWTTTLSSYCVDSTEGLLAGDVNGDGKGDLVCYDTASADGIAILPSVYTGSGSAAFSSVSFSDRPPGYPQGCEPGTSLFLSDLNGDGREDLVCRYGLDQRWYVSFAQPQGRFTSIDFQGPFAHWCSDPATQQVLTGPFKGTTRDDLLCISQSGELSQQFSNVPVFSKRCNETNSADLGAPGVSTTVANNACLMVKSGYPSWWGDSRAMQLQDPALGGGVPVAFVWHNMCTGSGGSGVFRNAWDDKYLYTTSSACPTYIELQGDGAQQVQVRYYGN